MTEPRPSSKEENTENGGSVKVDAAASLEVAATSVENTSIIPEGIPTKQEGETDSALEDSNEANETGNNTEPQKLPVFTKAKPLYIRYYSGHQGRHGHEFLEFDIRTFDDGLSGSLRYANNSNYRNDSLIRKEVTISPAVLREFSRIIEESEILQEDDAKWPPKNRDGKQELEIRLGKYHISFEVS